MGHVVKWHEPFEMELALPQTGTLLFCFMLTFFFSVLFWFSNWPRQLTPHSYAVQFNTKSHHWGAEKCLPSISYHD